jgi:hypothetical protein
MKKIQLKKEVIARISDGEMSYIKGGGFISNLHVLDVGTGAYYGTGGGGTGGGGTDAPTTTPTAPPPEVGGLTDNGGVGVFTATPSPEDYGQAF